MKYSLQLFLDNISIWIVFAPLLTGMLFFRYLKKDSKLIFILVILACIPQFLHGIQVSKKIEVITYNSYTFLEFFLWFFIFKTKFLINSNRVSFKISVWAYGIVSTLLFIKFSFVKEFISEWVCLNNILFTFWILLFILEQFYTDQIGFSFKNSFTWYISFEVLYGSCTFLVFSFWHYKENNIPVLDKIKILHNIFNILLYIGFCGGFFIDYLSNKKILEYKNG